MKFEWLDDKLTRVRVTRGFWRWKRVATLFRPPHWDEYTWEYDGTGERADKGFVAKIRTSRSREQEKRSYNRNWQPVRELLPVRKRRIIPCELATVKCSGDSMRGKLGPMCKGPGYVFETEMIEQPDYVALKISAAGHFARDEVKFIHASLGRWLEATEGKE